MDKEWLMMVLGLEDGTSSDEICRRMRIFQKLGTIKMSKKVIRILEGD